MTDVITLGWRERLALPELGIAGLKAKLDTGARSSALHVDALQPFERDGATWIHFSLSPSRRLPAKIVQCESPALGRRIVTDTGGRRSERWFIRSKLLLAGQSFEIDISLTDRRHMLFPMLLGRMALHGRFAVDPRLSYTQPRHPRAAPEIHEDCDPFAQHAAVFDPAAGRGGA